MTCDGSAFSVFAVKSATSVNSTVISRRVPPRPSDVPELDQLAHDLFRNEAGKIADHGSHGENGTAEFIDLLDYRM